MMTNKEREILEIIKENPSIEQAQIAELLGVTRSTVAVHISSLMKQGYLLGKGYIVSEEEDYIVGIGASNVDVYGKSRIPLRKHYDHPADITSSVGGVMHNIITNFTLLGGRAKMITAYGDDSYGKMIEEDYKNNGIDLSHSLKVKGASSGVFIQLQDEDNDMYMAVCDMSVLQAVTADLIYAKQGLLAGAKLVVIDPSLPDQTIEAIIDVCKGKTPIYIDPISDNFAKKVAPYVKDFEFIKPNRGELSCLAGEKTGTFAEIEKACEKLLGQGLKKIVISMSKDGIFYMDGGTRKFASFREEKHMVNASGAGDALMAAFLYGEVMGLPIEETIDLGLAAGIAAIRCPDPINKNMSIGLLQQIIKENKEI